MANFCSNCGNLVNAGSRFCSKCGGQAEMIRSFVLAYQMEEFKWQT